MKKSSWIILLLFTCNFTIAGTENQGPWKSKDYTIEYKEAKIFDAIKNMSRAKKESNHRLAKYYENKIKGLMRKIDQRNLAHRLVEKIFPE